MMIQILRENKGFIFQELESMEFLPLHKATIEDIKEYQEWLKEQLQMIEEILR